MTASASNGFKAVFLDRDLAHGFDILGDQGLAGGYWVVLLDEFVNVVIYQVILEYGGQLATKVGLEVSAGCMEVGFVVPSAGSWQGLEHIVEQNIVDVFYGVKIVADREFLSNFGLELC